MNFFDTLIIVRLHDLYHKISPLSWLNGSKGKKRENYWKEMEMINTVIKVSPNWIK